MWRNVVEDVRLNLCIFSFSTDRNTSVVPFQKLPYFSCAFIISLCTKVLYVFLILCV
ncbi:hypothetical protein FKM82_013555 [Ascaphus truei]